MATSLISIIALAIPGYLLTKKKIITTSALSPISNFLVYATTPTLIFCNFQDTVFSKSLLVNMAITAVLTILFFGIASIVIIAIVKPKTANITKKVTGFASFMPNVGFMGIPFLQAIYPNVSEPIIYCALISVIFNIFVWTTGSYILSGDKKYISAKNALTNPNAIALFLALPLFIANFHLEGIAPRLYSSISLLGNCTTPIAMLILGIRLADVPMKNIFLNKEVYVSTVIKLVVLPLVLYLALLPLYSFVDSLTLDVLFILLSMPTATVTVVFAEKILNDGRHGAACFVNSTLLSIVALPILLLLL